ncbi:MAG: adenosylmethionine decarboxylase [bacterium]
MKTLGQHLLVELFECNRKILDDEKMMEEILIQSAIIGGATVMKHLSHKYSPQGVSAIVIIAESHLSIHTWPEYGYAGCDIFACANSLKMEKALDYIVSQVEPTNFTLLEIKRGNIK